MMVLFLISSCAFSMEAQTLWNKTYIEDRPVLLFSSILKDSNSFYLTGVTTDFTNYDKAFFCMVDEAGIITKQKVLYDSLNKITALFNNALIKTANGEFVSTDYSGDSLARLLFTKFDNNLDSISIFEYYTPGIVAFYGFKILQYDDSSYYITGGVTDSISLNTNIFLAKIDSRGNRLWEKYYDRYTQDYAKSIVKLSNGNLLMGAVRRDLSQFNEHANTWLLEVDTDGIIKRQWLDPNDSTYTAEGLLQTQDGGIIYAAQKKHSQSFSDVYYTTTIVKMNGNFTKQWSFEGGIKGNFTGLVDIEELSDATYIACGNYSNKEAWIVKLGTQGNLIWERKYMGLWDTFPTWNMLTDIDVLPDGGLIAVGQCQRIVNPNQLLPQVGWFLKLDSNGCELENCVVGIDPLLSEGGFNGEIDVYPNPFTEDLVIELQKEGIKEAAFTITTLMGQVVYHKEEINLVGNCKLLDLSYLPSGIYFVSVAYEDVVVSKRVVKD